MSFNSAIKHLVAGLLALALMASPALAGEADEAAHHITHVMKAQFDTPESPLTVEPVTVGGDFAVAGWRQGDRGGRALLRRADGKWSIHLCSGDGLKDAAVLHQAGIPEEVAKDMAERLAAAEAKLDPAILKVFASFEGTVVIDESGAHGHGDGQGHKQHSGHGDHKQTDEVSQ